MIITALQYNAATPDRAVLLVSDFGTIKLAMIADPALSAIFLKQLVHSLPRRVNTLTATLAMRRARGSPHWTTRLLILGGQII
jgi:hypothetical protein